LHAKHRSGHDGRSAWADSRASRTHQIERIAVRGAALHLHAARDLELLPRAEPRPASRAAAVSRGRAAARGLDPGVSRGQPDSDGAHARLAARRRDHVAAFRMTDVSRPRTTLAPPAALADFEA